MRRFLAIGVAGAALAAILVQSAVAGHGGATSRGAAQASSSCVDGYLHAGYVKYAIPGTGGSASAGVHFNGATVSGSNSHVAGYVGSRTATAPITFAPGPGPSPTRAA